MTEAALAEVYSNIRKIAGILGIIQGLAWSIMSIMCISYHFREIIELNLHSYLDIVNFSMYGLYLATDEAIFNGQIVTGRPFLAFAFVSLFFNIGWVILSVILLRDNKASDMWSYFTKALSAWDILLVILFGVDYTKCMDFTEDFSVVLGEEARIGFQAICANGILPAMVIVARGFVLWCVNVFLAVIVKKSGKNLVKYEGQVYRP